MLEAEVVLEWVGSLDEDRVTDREGGRENFCSERLNCEIFMDIAIIGVNNCYQILQILPAG